MGDRFCALVVCTYDARGIGNASVLHNMGCCPVCEDTLSLSLCLSLSLSVSLCLSLPLPCLCLVFACLCLSLPVFVLPGKLVTEAKGRANSLTFNQPEQCQPLVEHIDKPATSINKPSLPFQIQPLEHIDCPNRCYQTKWRCLAMHKIRAALTSALSPHGTRPNAEASP